MANEHTRRQPPHKQAAALSYDMESDPAPRIVAKGKGLVAERIIEMAEEYGVPLYEDPTLVEMLVKLDLGDAIPYELYQVVAEVLSFIYRIENRARDGLL
jgi:flagellar biosynthesis protein